MRRVAIPTGKPAIIIVIVRRLQLLLREPELRPPRIAASTIATVTPPALLGQHRFILVNRVMGHTWTGTMMELGANRSDRRSVGPMSVSYRGEKRA